MCPEKVGAERRLRFNSRTQKIKVCVTPLGSSTGSLSRSPRYCLRLLQSGFTIQRFRPNSAGWNVIPIDEMAGSISESDLKAAAATNGLVLDYADAVPSRQLCLFAGGFPYGSGEHAGDQKRSQHGVAHFAQHSPQVDTLCTRRSKGGQTLKYHISN